MHFSIIIDIKKAVMKHFSILLKQYIANSVGNQLYTKFFPPGKALFCFWYTMVKSLHLPPQRIHLQKAVHGIYRFFTECLVFNMVSMRYQCSNLIVKSFSGQQWAAFPNVRWTFQTLFIGMNLLCSWTVWLSNLKTSTIVESERCPHFPVWPK